MMKLDLVCASLYLNYHFKIAIVTITITNTTAIIKGKVTGIGTMVDISSS